jgi:hypothetical protein
VFKEGFGVWGSGFGIRGFKIWDEGVQDLGFGRADGIRGFRIWDLGGSMPVERAVVAL